MSAPVTMRINTLTAGPLLRLLLALEGMEPPRIHPDRGWAVFKGYIALPSESPHDVASFEATWVAEVGDDPVLFCRFVRELIDAPEGAPAEVTRRIQLEYSYAADRADEFDDDLDDVSLSSSDFHSLAEFTTTVEQLPHFRLMTSTAPATCDLYEELDEAY